MAVVTVTDPSEPLIIQSQGSFAVGGDIVRAPDGRSGRGDHALVSYQVPVNTRPFPLVMLHGNRQSSKTWETTPDGREGFQTIFLRRGYSVYLVDQPRRGRAGLSSSSGAIEAEPDDQHWFELFRLGFWPDLFPGIQFSHDAEALNQFLRQATPNTAPFDRDVAAMALTALHDRIGPSILVTHSQGGGVGWFAALNTDNVRGIVSYEPGSNFPFPEGEVPASLDSSGGPLEAVAVNLEQFLRLTRIPIVIYFGDYIAQSPSPQMGPDLWRVRVEMSHKWVEAINRHGGQARLVELPKMGIRGNTHFPFSDLNNLEIADLMSAFLAENGLG